MRTDHVIALIARNRRQAHRFIGRELDRRGIRGLAPSHGAILSTLYERGPICMQDLARRIDRDKSTVTALVKRLVAAGYLRTGKEAGDSRRTIVRLTAKGRSLKPEFDDISRKLISRALKGFSRPERQALVGGLSRMLENW
ncbi:MAG: MarR family transcriptional regulator [Phycisphaerales bacterium]|nr:MAG: MarR family transcriptional regulator [Phycisphaerales bacterium]